MNTKAIVDALISLDPTDDSLWTTNGAPKMEPLATRAGIPGLTRQAVTEIAPDLARENHAAWVASKQTKTADGDAAVENEPEQEEVELNEDELEAARQANELEVAELEARVARRRKDIEEMDQATADIARERVACEKELQEAEEELERRKPKVTQADAIRAFTDSQHRQRAERMLGANEAAKHFGPDAARRYGGSPLDQRLQNRPSARVRARQAAQAAKQGS